MSGAAAAITALACPCHVVAGAAMAVAAAVAGTAPTLAPDVQDGVHAVYLPFAVAGAAWLLGENRAS